MEAKVEGSIPTTTAGISRDVAFRLQLQLQDSDRRLWLAGQALAGILANPTWNMAALVLHGIPEHQGFQVAAGLALQYADGLLQESKQ